MQIMFYHITADEIKQNLSPNYIFFTEVADIFVRQRINLKSPKCNIVSNNITTEIVKIQYIHVAW